MFAMLYALLSLLSDGGLTDCVPVGEEQLPSSTLEQGYERELLCAKEYNNDVWRSPRSVNVSCSGANRSMQSRHRTTYLSKITPQTPSERRAGHVTHIFEFNHYRSSLRVGYYLYALCRLRI